MNSTQFANKDDGLDASFSSEYVECTRGKYFNIFVILTPVGCTLISFFGIIVFMTLLCRHAILIEKMFRINDDETGPSLTVNNTNNVDGQANGSSTARGVSRLSGSSNANSNSSDERTNHGFFSYFSLCCNKEEHYRQRTNESNANYLLRLSRRETVIQAILYAQSFFVSYLAILVAYITNTMGISTNPWLRLITLNGLYPFLGFFNILVYTRPKVTQFRMAHNHVSWLKAFCLVVKAGGELPDDDRLGCCLWSCCPSTRASRFYDGVSDISSAANDSSQILLRIQRWRRSFVASISRNNRNNITVGAGEEPHHHEEITATFPITNGGNESTNL